MNFHIYGKFRHGSVEQDPNKKYFTLESRGPKIDLVAVDSRGVRLCGGFILSITEAGMIQLHSSITSQSGLQLTASGCPITIT